MKPSERIREIAKKLAYDNSRLGLNWTVYLPDATIHYLDEQWEEDQKRALTCGEEPKETCNEITSSTPDGSYATRCSQKVPCSIHSKETCQVQVNEIWKKGMKVSIPIFCGRPMPCSIHSK